MISGKTLVFFGNERIATGVSTSAPTLTALIANGYKIAAVVSNFEPGQSRNTRTLEIQSVAQEHHIPVLLPDKPSDIHDQLAAYGAEAAVLVAYGKIVPQSIIDIFPKGIINVHPSILPRHRGPTPIESAILADESKTGVSIMSLAKAMDAGAVYGQSEIDLTGNETKRELADTLLDIGVSMIIELLPGILDGSIVALPQDESHATYDQLITKQDGVIDWSKPADRIEREIRAYAEWPKSKATLAGIDTVITKGTIVSASGSPGSIQVSDKQLVVYCGNRALRIESLKPAGKNEMPATAFLAGYGHRIKTQ